ncbi:MAG: SDR family oxidoreductase [Candidatus Nitrosocosmicus sp.]|nr:SDR family oxidoreductase [Candidatus Nitrosocosmicus sp.]MDN5868511.1 SDR family oxidoreductase [Candidatus Nitrosocosmicus sp.]
MSLLDKVAIVTGSSKGIGFEIAKEFSGRGAIVIVCSRNLDQSKKAAAQIMGTTLALEVDVTNESNVKKFIKDVVNRYHKIDILVNNSGYPFDDTIWNKKIHEGSTDELEKIIRVDLIGSVRLCQAVLPVMMQTSIDDQSSNITGGGGVGGVIINISSTPAISGNIGGFPYSISKSGNITLTKCIAKEYSSFGIRAYTLALGNIATPATLDSMTEQIIVKAALESPMKRWGKPNEVAKVAASLADDNFSYVTGNTIVIDGGTVLI